MACASAAFHMAYNLGEIAALQNAYRWSPHPLYADFDKYQWMTSQWLEDDFNRYIEEWGK